MVLQRIIPQPTEAGVTSTVLSNWYSSVLRQHMQMPQPTEVGTAHFVQSSSVSSRLASCLANMHRHISSFTTAFAVNCTVADWLHCATSLCISYTSSLCSFFRVHILSLCCSLQSYSVFPRRVMQLFSHIASPWRAQLCISLSWDVAATNAHPVR